jgi:aminoglycoside 6'-N-acetyltransferase
MSRWTFRPIARSDFARLSTWLRQPHVARWWADDPSMATLEKEYGPNVDGKEPSEVFIAARDGQDVGLAQRYRIAAYPAHAKELGTLVTVSESAWSIDYLIGPGAHLGQGWGREMIGEFVAQLWEQCDAVTLLVPVHAENVVSRRALESCGFRLAAVGPLAPDNPADSRDHLVYALDRPAPSEE